MSCTRSLHGVQPGGIYIASRRKPWRFCWDLSVVTNPLTDLGRTKVSRRRKMSFERKKNVAKAPLVDLATACYIQIGAPNLEELQLGPFL